MAADAGITTKSGELWNYKHFTVTSATPATITNTTFT